MSSRSGVFFGGIPTEIEVERLRKAFPLPTPGQKITHESIASITGNAAKTCRYRTVLVAWRTKLRHDGIYLKAITGVGFTVCTAGELVDESGKKLYSAGKRIKRSGEMATAAAEPELNPEQKTRKAWLLRNAAVLSAEFASMRHALVADLKRTEVLPRPKEG